MDGIVALGLIYGKGSSCAQGPGSDDWKGNRVGGEGGGGGDGEGEEWPDLSVFIHSLYAQCGYHHTEVNEQSLIKYVHIHSSPGRESNGASCRVRMQTCYSQLVNQLLNLHLTSHI